MTEGPTTEDEFIFPPDTDEKLMQFAWGSSDSIEPVRGKLPSEQELRQQLQAVPDSRSGKRVNLREEPRIIRRLRKELDRPKGILGGVILFLEEKRGEYITETRSDLAALLEEYDDVVFFEALRGESGLFDEFIKVFDSEMTSPTVVDWRLKQFRDSVGGEVFEAIKTNKMIGGIISEEVQRFSRGTRGMQALRSVDPENTVNTTTIDLEDDEIDNYEDLKKHIFQMKPIVGIQRLNKMLSDLRKVLENFRIHDVEGEIKRVKRRIKRLLV